MLSVENALARIINYIEQNTTTLISEQWCHLNAPASRHGQTPLMEVPIVLSHVKFP